MRADDMRAHWRALPVGSLSDIIGTGCCLVVAPHPDDESLGCGGLIAACCRTGRPPLVAILTDGGASHPGSRLYPPPRLAARRRAESATAVRILSLPEERLRFLGASDGAAPTAGPEFDATVRRLGTWARECGCSAILSTWRGDPHCDHEAAAQIAAAAARNARLRHLEYPVWGWILPGETLVAADAIRGWRLDITAQRAVKCRAIAAHASQCEGISDAPDGFRLPDDLRRAMDVPWETFLLP